MNFITVLIPIFGIFAIGYIGKKALHIEVKPISTMALYLMSPVLAFRTFYQNSLNMEYVYLGAFLLLLCAGSIALCYIVSRLTHWDISERSGLILASSFMNNGNYGTPLVLLVFGEVGFHYAVILMVLQQLIMCTVGIFVAAQGSTGEHNQKVNPLKEVVKFPVVYGALLGVIFNLVQVNLSSDIMTAVNMVSDATIPTVMIVLGMQLASIQLGKLETGKLSSALAIRLVIAPVMAYVITLFLPVDDMLKDILILMAAMPTAANTTMYALQFNVKPAFVSSATLISTISSIVTLPLLIAILL
ncbi:AEC family transporter [Aquibacillus salsiterrae]|uniref:AEC family transporter n=1 Tax=Aquibacillus salsiterrae TaxID=2950439 RepID=A0A9X3WBY1_9BACI|nr:AEC family transporter [Aquibacillus salsiterrae]MDC3416912.1 AEC family transporter [Aquibacillus salsiterrae]